MRKSRKALNVVCVLLRDENRSARGDEMIMHAVRAVRCAGFCILLS